MHSERVCVCSVCVACMCVCSVCVCIACVLSSRPSSCDSTSINQENNKAAPPPRFAVFSALLNISLLFTFHTRHSERNC